jgi:hypothetical protein
MLTRNAFHDAMASQPGVSKNDNGGSIRRFEGLVLRMLQRLTSD